MTMYVHKDWPRDLIHKESGARREFKRPEDVPPGWFTVDTDEEINPTEGSDDASEQALRTVRGGGSDAKPRGKGRKRGHTEPDGSDAGVQDEQEPG